MVTGFSYHPFFLSCGEQTALLTELGPLCFRQDTFRGVPMRRTIICYGNDYDAQRHSARKPAPEIPAYLAPIRDRAAAIAGIEAETLTQAIIWRYPAKIGIGWHADNPAYGPVICGVSLAAHAVMKLKREVERHRFELAPGSLYILRDEARYDWMHSVDGNREERYSITFRSMS
jgi:alkylated DNA repair protein (DNA oxidative demethylase)